MTKRILGIFAVAGLLAVGLASAAESPRVAQRQVEKRLAKVEERLALVQPQGPLAETLVAKTKTQLELSRRFLKADNAEAAKVHADIAERFTVLAEGKAVQQ